MYFRSLMEPTYTMLPEDFFKLEDNELTKRAVRLMDGELYKVYRVYEKRIA